MLVGVNVAAEALKNEKSLSGCCKVLIGIKSAGWQQRKKAKCKKYISSVKSISKASTTN